MTSERLEGHRSAISFTQRFFPLVLGVLHFKYSSSPLFSMLPTLLS